MYWKSLARNSSHDPGRVDRKIFVARCGSFLVGSDCAGPISYGQIKQNGISFIHSRPRCTSLPGPPSVGYPKNARPTRFWRKKWNSERPYGKLYSNSYLILRKCLIPVRYCGPCRNRGSNNLMSPQVYGWKPHAPVPLACMCSCTGFSTCSSIPRPVLLLSDPAHLWTQPGTVLSVNWTPSWQST